MPKGGSAVQVSLLIPARSAAHSLEATVRAASAYLEAQFGSAFEIVLIPNDRPGETSTLEVSRRLAHTSQSLDPNDGARIVCAPHEGPPGKGTALKTGFRAARGQWIFMTDADLPYELEFFTRATRELSSGIDFVTGNRRLGSSEFSLPVELLPVAYNRHRLGLAFNAVVRLLFGVRTTDTQAGIKAMSRRFAEAAFSDQVCPGFFFDLEFFLTAQGRGFQHRELPVVLRLESEKSTVRIVRESLQAAYWLSRIFALKLRAHYGSATGEGARS